MFDWFKKKPIENPPAPRKLYVPEPKIKEVLAVWDSYTLARKEGGGALMRYNFWELACSVFPEISTGKWSAEMTTKPHFKEILEDD